MSYQHEHIAIYDTETGYNLLSKSFFRYHKSLDIKESWGYEKYLPRSLATKHILDLGSGDGRIAKKFVGKGLALYTCVDIASDIVEKCPTRTEKVVGDISKPLELKHNSYELIFVFHSLLHIQHILPVFENIVKFLTPEGICVIAHHNDRRPILYELNNKAFKIETFFHSDAEIHSCAKSVGLSVIEQPMDDTCFFILRHW